MMWSISSILFLIFWEEKLEKDSVSRFLISYCSLLRKDKIVHVFTIFDLKWFKWFQKHSQSLFSNLQCHHTLIINALGLIHGSPIWMTTLDPDDWNSIASMWLWISNEISSPYFGPKSPDQIKNHFLQSYHIKNHQNILPFFLNLSSKRLLFPAGVVNILSLNGEDDLTSSYLWNTHMASKPDGMQWWWGARARMDV